jgi:succinoglycan biosynthesis transport protein ExoP
MEEGSTSYFDINWYLGLIQRRRYLVIAIALGVLSLFTWGSFLMSNKYESSATVTIEKSGLINPLIQGVGVSAPDERLRKIRNTITARNMIERVIKKLNLGVNIKNKAQYDAYITGIQKSLSVTVRSVGGERMDPDLFTISFRGSNPKEVKDFVETLVNEFIEESVQYQRSDAVGAYDFINAQLEEYKKKLEGSDKAIREFREKNPHMVPQNESTIAGRIENFQTVRIETEIRLKELMRKRDSLKKQLSGEKELTVAFVSRDGSPEGRLQQLNNQLMVLMGKYTDDYPEVIRIKSEIEELQKQIAEASTLGKETKDNDAGMETRALNPVYRQIKEELSKTDTEIESLKAREDEIIKQQNEGRAILGRMPKEQEEWSKLQRDRSVLQTVYDDLLHKLETARVSKNLELADKSTTFRVVDAPIQPRLPVTPNRVKLILLGLVLGIAAGVGATIGLDYIDPSYKNEKSLQDELQLPVLASVPAIITEADLAAEARLDRKVYRAAAVYLSLIGAVFLLEVLYRFKGIQLLHFLAG